MKNMPKEIKQKLKKYGMLIKQSQELGREIECLFEEYGIDSTIFRAEADFPADEQTEALTYIEYGEGSVEENIADIEEIFLLHVNRR